MPFFDYDSVQFVGFLFGESMSWFYSPFAYVQRRRNEYRVWLFLQHENETLCALKWAVFLAFMLAIQLFNFFSVTALIYWVVRMAFAPVRWGWQALKRLLFGITQESDAEMVPSNASNELTASEVQVLRRVAAMMLTPSHVPQEPQQALTQASQKPQQSRRVRFSLDTDDAYECRTSRRRS